MAHSFSRNENNPEESILGIMCMTENNSPDNLVEELAYNIIPPSSDAGFLISESRLIKKMILPTLPNAFKGLKEEDFGMGEDGKSLHLVSTDKSFCVIYEDKTYNAMLERFDISLQGGKLCLHAETKTEITEGIYAHSIQDHSYQISLYTKADGSQSLRYIECGKPVILNSTSQDNTTTFLEVFYSIIAGIILAVLIAITDGLVLVLVVIIGGLLVGLISTASEIIQLVGTNDAPDISLLVLNCTDPIQWTDKKDFLLNLATLNGPLQLGGFFKT